GALFQVFQYDGVNRLLKAGEYAADQAMVTCPDATSKWCEQYGYDAWGNRGVVGRTGVTASTRGSPTDFDTSNNRIRTTATQPNWDYDSRGNIKKNELGETFLYDGENRVIAFCTNDPTGCPNASGPGRTLYTY